MRRVFLDVGAWRGQATAAALDPEFNFDWVVAFEPASPNWPYLEKITDHRFNFRRYGLWNTTCLKDLWYPGFKGAGLWPKDYATTGDSELCQFRWASGWFQDNIQPTDAVWLKLNCEGAEYDILNDLMDSGEFNKVTYLLVSFHGVPKLPMFQGHEINLRIRLRQRAFSRLTAYNEMPPNNRHTEMVKEWLWSCV